MPLIEWDETFSVGSARMDDDHRKLLDLLNRLYDAWHGGESIAELGWLLDELMAYAETHFAAEERMLMAAGYSRLDEQVDGHRQLLTSVKGFRERYLSGDQPAELTEEMTRFLKTWLLEHILGEDMRYKSCMTGA